MTLSTHMPEPPAPAPTPGPERPLDPPVPARLAPDGASVIVLDQTALPEQEVERTLATLEDVEEAIRSLRVRGAPLIGITAALGVAALARREARNGRGASPDDVHRWCDRLGAARPTAVNLVWALDRMRSVADRTAEPDSGGLADALATEAEAIQAEDRVMCRRIGEHALPLLSGPSGDITLLTHCNAGAMATGGIGTALAPIYLAHERGDRLRVFADETRPLLQGSRITAWELGRAGIDVTVVADGTAGALMASDPPDAVLVGADRIAANGDAANKIGTYGLAVLARHHDVPFYVLAPTSTVDLATPTGSDIPVEHRDADEIRRGFGKLTAPADASVWSPAFDVTPAALITAIVTEHGVVRPPFGPGLAAAVEAADPDRRRRDAGPGGLDEGRTGPTDRGSDATRADRNDDP